jgi:hypothetical protein
MPRQRIKGRWGERLVLGASIVVGATSLTIPFAYRAWGIAGCAGILAGQVAFYLAIRRRVSGRETRLSEHLSSLSEQERSAQIAALPPDLREIVEPVARGLREKPE